MVIGEPVTKFNHKSIQRHSPVLNRHRPFFRSLRNGQVNHLTRRVVAGEDLAAFRRCANDAIERFNGIGCINRFADFRWVFVDRPQVRPVCLPRFCNLRIQGIPRVTKPLQFCQRLVFGRGLVNSLQIAGDAFVVLP